MFVAPSPQMLLHHKNKFYKTQLLKIEFISQNNERFEIPRDSSQFILDMAFTYSINRQPCSDLTRIDATSLLSQSSHQSLKSIYLGFLAKRLNYKYSALKCFIDASKNGSVEALNFIGKLYEECFFHNDLALKWYARSYRLNLTDSFFSLGWFFYTNNEYLKSLFFLQKHFRETNSLFTAMQIGKALEKMNQTELSMKWYKLCAVNGMKSAVTKILFLLGPDYSTLYHSIFQWLPIATRFNIKVKKQPPNNCWRLKDKNWHLSNYLRANYSNDYSIPSTSTIKHQIQIPDQFIQISSTRNVLQHTVSEKFDHAKTNPIFAVLQLQSILNTSYMFPSESNTQILLAIFECCSKNPVNRNLVYASFLLKKLQLKTNFKLFESRLWLSKCKSHNSIDLMQCGFVCALLNDYASAFDFFSKSRNLSSSTMCGIILFHGLSDGERDVEHGLYYFGKNSNDPVSLLYIGAVSNEEEYYERAAYFLRCDAKVGILAEKVGDLFYNGLQYPKNIEIAKLWYGKALDGYERQGCDTNKIMKKLSDAVYDEMSIA